MSSSKFTFFIEDINYSLEHEIHISQWLSDIATSEKRSIESIEYIFCSDIYLLEINKTHLNHDYFTDIITFPMNLDPIEATIFISIDRIRENAQQFKQHFIDELHRVIAHGLLHLVGYNDKTEKESKIMRTMENKVLSMRSLELQKKGFKNH